MYVSDEEFEAHAKLLAIVASKGNESCSAKDRVAIYLVEARILAPKSSWEANERSMDVIGQKSSDMNERHIEKQVPPPKKRAVGPEDIQASTVPITANGSTGPSRHVSVAGMTSATPPGEARAFRHIRAKGASVKRDDGSGRRTS